MSMSSSSSSDVRPRQVKKPILTHQYSSGIGRPPVPRTSWKSEGISGKHTSATTPIDLSLADDEYGRAHSGSLSSSSRLGDPTSPARDRHKLAKRGMGSPVEDADLLYEYFPLSLDDW